MLLLLRMKFSLKLLLFLAAVSVGFLVQPVNAAPAIGGGPGVVSVPDGGTTVMLLGAALGALGMARRFLKM